jgi:hypothetical protein
VAKFKKFFDDINFIKAVEKLLFNELLHRLKDRTERIFCANCKSFAECKLGPMMRGGEIIPGGIKALNDYLAEQAKECNNYIPHEDVSSTEYWEKYTKTLRGTCKRIELNLSESFFEEVEKAGKESVYVFLEKIKKEKKMQ